MYKGNDNLPLGNIALQYVFQNNCRKVWWCFLRISCIFWRSREKKSQIHQNYLVALRAFWSPCNFNWQDVTQYRKPAHGGLRFVRRAVCLARPLFTRHRDYRKKNQNHLKNKAIMMFLNIHMSTLHAPIYRNFYSAFVFDFFFFRTHR